MPLRTVMNPDTPVQMDEQAGLEINESEPQLTDFLVEQTTPAGISGYRGNNDMTQIHS